MMLNQRSQTQIFSLLLLLNLTSVCDAENGLFGGREYRNEYAEGQRRAITVALETNADLHFFDKLLESGADPDSICMSLSDRVGMKIPNETPPSNSIIQQVVKQWSDFPERFEVCLRYSKKNSVSKENDSLAHLLAKHGCNKDRQSSNGTPILHFTDLFTLSLNGFQVNDRNSQGEIPLIVYSKRLRESNLSDYEAIRRMDYGVLSFLASGTSKDSLSLEDILRLTTLSKGTKSSIKSSFVDFTQDQMSEMSDALKPLGKNTFGGGNVPYSNQWCIVRTNNLWIDKSSRQIADKIRSHDDSDRNDILSQLVASNPEGWIDKSEFGGVTLLLQAYAYRDLELMEILLEHGASPDIILETDYYELLDNSIRSVLSPTFCPTRGDTILLAASLDPFRKFETIPMVLKYTKTPDARDLLNRNALHRFLYHRVQDHQKFLLKMLVDAGVDVNAKSVSGNTPCHVAANRNASLILEMVDAGADLYAKNDRGETPVDLLKRSLDEKWIFHEENQVILDQLKSQGHIKE